MVATELALNNPLIDEYTLQGAKGLLVNITGGSDIKLFEVDQAVNKIRAEVDPEAELIFGAIKDENMNGKIRVSIVATALHGSEAKPYLNLVNNNSTIGGSAVNRGYKNDNDSLFNNNHVEKNVLNSIDGATALKLDESYEVKNIEEQKSLIDSFENTEENLIAENNLLDQNNTSEIPSGVSIESASYIENNNNIDETISQESSFDSESVVEEHTPKLFQRSKSN